MRRLEIVLHAVVENYEEFKDYNTTTTQSDYGENLHVLLEFLRLKAVYERHAWQMRPLILAHEVLARSGRDAAAVRWEQTLGQFTRELARTVCWRSWPGWSGPAASGWGRWPTGWASGS